ncbi:hypothetical protein SDC9_85331 [bioreactor metagenome]|uniref:Phosphatidic acid phosphatase type 2/haloperoxidase domain-containing protein n=1 Tax=bioreactor metagenome TaxID=1076179 RepID=A0A644ZFN6_9ZZZZ
MFITYLAKGEIITVGVIVFSLILFLIKKWRFLKALLISVLGGELFIWIIKNLVDRPRPPLINAIVNETTYSFPSGHTFVAIAFYGLLGYFIIQSERNKFIKIISLFFISLLIILIGLSRIYLGAHWPSDVLASFVSGAAWLSILITWLKIKNKFLPLPKPKDQFKKVTIITSSFLLISIWTIFVIGFYFTHPLSSKTEIIKTKTVINTKDIPHQLFQNLPKVSESISGIAAEPINMIFVGNKKDIDNAFNKSSWYLLDGPSLKSYTKIITSLLFNQSYPTTPGLPVFWDTQPSQFAYGKPTTPESISSREHIHFWETDFITQDSQNIWVGTAHFDQQIKKKLGIVMPFHTTETRVDNQRESIKNELDKNGFIQKTEKIDLTGLSYGVKKGSGNSFLTDGQAYIIFIKSNNEKR